MKQYSSIDLARRTREILDEAVLAPIAIAHDGGPALVIMKADHYDRMNRHNPRTAQSVETVPAAVREEMLKAVEIELGG